MTANDQPLPHLHNGHLISGWQFVHPDGASTEDVYMRCEDLQHVDREILARVHAEDRAYPSLVACGRHGVE
jgi:hypothetical protein